jgi:hypothetical protein
MMLDTSTYYAQPTLVPPQFLPQGLFGQPHGQQGQHFGGFLPQGLFGQPQGLIGQPWGQYGQQQPIWPSLGFAPQIPFGHLPVPYGQQPIWPPFGFIPQSPFSHLPGQYGQHPTWPAFGGGLGQFAPLALASQLGFGIGQLGGFAPQFGALGQHHPMSVLGRGTLPYQGVPGILPYQGVPQVAYAGC